MMTVYNIARHQFRFLLSPNLESEKRLSERKPEGSRLYLSESMADIWEDVEMELEEKVRKKLPNDWRILLSSTSLLTFSERGYDQYGEMLTDFGEFLPATFNGQPVHVFHCTNIIECMDREKTDYQIGHECGPIMNFRKLVLKAEMLQPNIMFRTVKLPSRRLWITTGSGKADLLQMFLENQTGFVLQPIAVYPDQ